MTSESAAISGSVLGNLAISVTPLNTKGCMNLSRFDRMSGCLTMRSGKLTIA